MIGKMKNHVEVFIVEWDLLNIVLLDNLLSNVQHIQNLYILLL